MINPIIVRKARAQFRLERTGLVVLTAAYLLTLILTFFINYFLSESLYSSWEECLRYYWCGLLIVQVFVLVVVGGIKVACSIACEREQKRFDFEIVTGMSPWMIATGELFGSILFPCFLIACTLPFSLLCALGGGVSWTHLGYSYLILFTGGFFFHSWALVASAVSRSSTASVVAAVTIIGVLSAAVFLDRGDVGAFSHFSVLSPFYLPVAVARSAELRYVGFFQHMFPELFAVAVLYLFFGMWALNGAVRRIERREAPYISRLQAIVFTGLFCLGLTGVLSGREAGAGGDWNALFYENTAIYLTGVLFIVIIFAFMLSPPLDLYLRGRRGGKGAGYAILGEHSLLLANLAILLTVCATVYFVVFVHVTPNAGLAGASGSRRPFADIVASFAVLVLVAFFYSLVVQLGAFLSRRFGRQLAALFLLFLVLLPGLSDISTSHAQVNFSHVLNPATVFLHILPIGQQSSTLSIQALLFYFSLSVLLGVALLLLRARLTPVHPTTENASPPDYHTRHRPA